MPSETVKSAARVIEIFECFERIRHPMTLSDLVDQLDIPQSSMSSLISSLVKLGYMTHEPDTRLYAPSVRLSMLGNWVTNQDTNMETIQPLMQELNEATGESVILGTDVGPKIKYILVLEAQRDLKSSIWSGMWRPLCASTLGLVLLSEKTDAEVGLIVRRANAETASLASRVDQAALLNEIREVRRRGYAISENLTTTGAGGLGMMLSPPNDRPRLALGLGVLLTRLRCDDEREELLAALRKTVARYRELGSPVE